MKSKGSKKTYSISFMREENFFFIEKQNQQMSKFVGKVCSMTYKKAAKRGA